jgi:adenylate kinase family enzyme
MIRTPLQRIMIVGQCGSGKSTLARRISERTGLPAIHVDKIHWQPGWVERSTSEKTRLCMEAEQGERWVFEGGHSATWPSRLARADMVVWIDLPVALRIRRVIWRSLSSWRQNRPDMADGCQERLRMLPEFLHYIWRTRNSARAKIGRLLATSSNGVEVVHLRSVGEVDAFVRGFHVTAKAGEHAS